MENTSKISKVVYKIEDLLYKGNKLEDLKLIINKMKEDGDFPSNLELEDVTISKTGVCGAAFKDSNTGEVIVGFAGTNINTGGLEGAKDILADVQIGANGLLPNGPYLKDANEFIKKLKSQGYNVTQLTGHSLGGAISVLVGINNNIPLVITYNGAPLYVLDIPENSYSDLVEQQIKELEKNYNGKVIRFVTDKDPLNNIADIANGYYIGEEIKFSNGKGHAMDFFLEDIEQNFIEAVLRSKTGKSNINSVDFDNDNEVDLVLEPEKLIIKNLLSNSNNSYSNVKRIKIDSDALTILAGNLIFLVEDDIGWIKKGINLCINKNELIKSKKLNRDKELKYKIVDELKNAELNNLLASIDYSHGELTNIKNKTIIQELMEFNTYSITRKFDFWGESGGRKWFYDGFEFDESDLIRLVKNIKSTAGNLFWELNSTGEYKGYISGKEIIYKYDSISTIGEAFVNVTNKFLSKTEKVFNGIGLRSGKSDGIVNALTEILEVENRNIDEVAKKLYNLALMTQGISTNFKDIDNKLGNDILSINTTNNIVYTSVEQSYEMYLDRNGILDDVKGVVEAMDNQVEHACDILSREIVKDYEDLILRTYKKFKNISSKIVLFNQGISEIYSVMKCNITSTKLERKINPKYVPTSNEYNYYVYEENKYEHGTLESLLPADVAENIIYAKYNIVPYLEKFYIAMNIATLYKDNILNLRVYFKNVIEKAIYSSMDLSEIIQSQNMILSVIKRMEIQLNNLATEIQVGYEGKVFKLYEIEVINTAKSINYVSKMLEECFGTKQVT